MTNQKYIVRPVQVGQRSSLGKRMTNWWIFTMIPRKKKHSGPFYSRWEAQQQLDQILNK